MTDELTITERTELEQYEAVIERGLQTFYEVGAALLDIRDRRLYKEYGSFEEYCRTKWGFQRRQANLLIQATQVVENIKMGSIDPILPESEGQIRPLSQLKEPEQQRQAWQIAIETANITNGRITHKHVEAAVEAIRRIEQGSQSRRILHSSESNEWYTPRQYIEAVQALLGQIDLDPASSELANETVRAVNYFTIEDDGLNQEWDGTVFLNPPYGRDGGQEAWSGKLIEEYEAGRVTEAVLLVNAVTDTKWFQRLWNYTICFVDHRISFDKPGGGQDRPTHGNVFVYFGPNYQRFINIFNQFGVIAQRIG